MQQIGGILITDGGPHPPDKWAAMTAQRIIEDIAPQVVAVDDQYHEVMKSSHPKVVAFRKALRGYEAWLREAVEEHHADIQQRVRGGESPDTAMHDIETAARALVDGAKQFHVGLHGHLSADGAMAAMVHRLQMDFGSIIDIERQWKENGFAVDESHRAVKTGPA